MNSNRSVDPIDVAFEALQRLLKELPTFASTLNSEADVRLKIVDTMLSDVLGWTKSKRRPKSPQAPDFLITNCRLMESLVLSLRRSAPNACSTCASASVDFLTNYRGRF